MKKPNVVFIMCDQLRGDAIASLGNTVVKTPNMDRLVARGVSFNRAYSSCPVCVPARYTIRTGCEPYNIAIFQNETQNPTKEQPKSMKDRCGKYLGETMSNNGYRTFGIGKFHSNPWNEDLGYDVHLHSEELLNPDTRTKDSYSKFILKEHPEFGFIEQMHGERTDMYYVPQMSPLPAEITVEAWAADRAVEQINIDDDRPYFGMVSFIGPHPPCAPPIPYNRMYNPDNMPNPIKGDINIDHMDEQISFMNYIIWANDINDFQARGSKSRYYGEITYIDDCLGKILDAIEAKEDSDNTVICFFSDHGDHLGDHHSWQKESYFDASCRIPFLVSWPEKLPQNIIKDDFVGLCDLFGIATYAADNFEKRDGINVLGIILDEEKSRECIYGYYGQPGTSLFKIMVRMGDWKYIYMANGGREQLFNLVNDPNEICQEVLNNPRIAKQLRDIAINKLKSHCALIPALSHDNLKAFEFTQRELSRIHQFSSAHDVSGFIYP